MALHRLRTTVLEDYWFSSCLNGRTSVHSFIRDEVGGAIWCARWLARSLHLSRFRHTLPTCCSSSSVTTFIYMSVLTTLKSMSFAVH